MLFSKKQPDFMITLKIQMIFVKYFSQIFRNLRQIICMKFTASRINRFLLFKLPAAYFTGVRLHKITDQSAIIKVRHRWINQNPFRSLYYGVQAMAAELSTGVLVMKKIYATGKPVSMLVTRQEAEFTKKATGLITFTCSQAALIDEALQKTLVTGEGQVIKLQSQGIDESGEQVSAFEFEWSIKLKTKSKK